MIVVAIVLMAMFVFLVSMLVDRYDGDWHGDRDRVRQARPMVAMAGMHDTCAQGECRDGGA